MPNIKEGSLNYKKNLGEKKADIAWSKVDCRIASGILGEEYWLKKICQKVKEWFYEDVSL